MKNLFILLLPVLLLPACKKDPIIALQEKLVKLDKAMGGANVNDKAKADEFIKTSEELAALVEKNQPDQYAEVLLKAAGLAKTIEQPQKAIELYTKVAEGMPQHKKAPTALFMIGFVQENDLNDLSKAKATYETFLQRYPNDPDFADDAQNALKMLGKSPEEIIREFEKQGQGDTKTQNQ
ncbi:MAG: tetratricopeptide repeat protein [Saprospiraceae bacterium]|nr:tetratricopeptide repeat protein [Saprospiraceae bacterium]